MHTFQPLPFDLVEFNPFTKIGKEWALVTAGSREKANTMTVSWGGVGVLFSDGAGMRGQFSHGNLLRDIEAMRGKGGSSLECGCG